MSNPDNRTLEEIYKDDTEMFMYKLEKECKRYEFFGFTQARNFQRELLDRAIKKMGVPDKVLHTLKKQTLTDETPYERDTIRVENRTAGHHEKWKSGIYVYRMNKDGSHGDLAYFISQVFRTRENEFMRSGVVGGLRVGNRDNTNKYYVMTNVPTDDMQRSYSIIAKL